jgi:hypothetical protein
MPSAFAFPFDEDSFGTTISLTKSHNSSFMKILFIVLRIHKNTMLHIQGNTRHRRGNDRIEALVITFGK